MQRQDLENLIGEKAALELLAAYQGQRVYVHRRMSDRHPIARLIGLDNARKLVDSLDPTDSRLDFRSCGMIGDRTRQQVRADKTARILAAVVRGESRKVIAAREGVSEDAVRKVITRHVDRLTPSVSVAASLS